MIEEISKWKESNREMLRRNELEKGPLGLLSFTFLGVEIIRLVSQFVLW